MKLTWKQTKNHDKPWRYLENLESQQRTMKTHETTTKKTWNYPENYETTLKNHENQSRIMKNCKNILKKHENTLSNFRDSHGLGALFNGLTSAVVPQNWQISGMHFSWQTDFFFAKIIFFVTDTHRPCAPAMNIDHHLHHHHLGNWAARRWGSRLQHDFSLTHLLNVAQGQIKGAWSHKTRVILILSSTSPQGLLLNL